MDEGHIEGCELLGVRSPYFIPTSRYLFYHQGLDPTRSSWTRSPFLPTVTCIKVTTIVAPALGSCDNWWSDVRLSRLATMARDNPWRERHCILWERGVSLAAAFTNLRNSRRTCWRRFEPATICLPRKECGRLAGVRYRGYQNTLAWGKEGCNCRDAERWKRASYRLTLLWDRRRQTLSKKEINRTQSRQLLNTRIRQRLVMSVLQVELKLKIFFTFHHDIFLQVVSWIDHSYFPQVLRERIQPHSPVFIYLLLIFKSRSDEGQNITLQGSPDMRNKILKDPGGHIVRGAG